MAQSEKNERSDHGAKTFVKGALILSIAGLVAKVLSAIFRIPLGNLIGDTGMGYYQAAYPVYTLLTAIATAGVPLAIAKLVAEKRVLGEYQAAKDILTHSLRLMAILGALISLFIFIGTPWMIQLFGWAPETKYSLWGLALAPFFVCIMGTFKGYFQGTQNMLPVALAQVTENLGRVVLGLVLAFALFPDLGKAAGGASFGGVVGGLLGTILLLALYMRHKKVVQDEIEQNKQTQEIRLSFKEVTKLLCIIAIPIAIGAGASSIFNFLDSALVIQSLTTSGVSLQVANESFGQLGKITTFINFPLTFGLALVTGIIPAIAEAVARQDKEEVQYKIELGLRIVILIALPASAGLFVLAHPIMNFVYANAPAGSSLLAISAIALVFMMIVQIFTGILQGVGKVWQPVIGIGIAAMVKAILNIILVATPLGVSGAALSSIAAYAIFAVYMYVMMRKYTGFKLNTNLVVIKPLIATAIMGLVTWTSYTLLSTKIGVDTLTKNALITLIGIGIGGVTYLIMIFIIGAVTKNDLREILNKKEK